MYPKKAHYFLYFKSAIQTFNTDYLDFNLKLFPVVFITKEDEERL